MSSQPNRAAGERACQSCGCTESRACLGGCAWIAGLDGALCSACAAMILVRKRFAHELVDVPAAARGEILVAEDLGGAKPRLRLRLELEVVLEQDQLGRLGELFDVRGPLGEALRASTSWRSV